MRTKPKNLCYHYSVLPPTVSYKLWRDLQGPFSRAVATAVAVTCMPHFFLQASLVKYLTRGARPPAPKLAEIRFSVRDFLRTLWLKNVGRMLDAYGSLMCA